MPMKTKTTPSKNLLICRFPVFFFLSNGFSFSFLTSEMTKSLEAAQRKFQYVPKFAKQMMDVVAESNAFPYPHLLPKIPFRMDYRDKGHLSEFVPIED